MDTQSINLGQFPIVFGMKGDPHRIQELVGDFPHALDTPLAPGRFAVRDTDLDKWGGRGGIDIWPEDEDGVQRLFELVAVCFHKDLPNFEAVAIEAIGRTLLAGYLPAGFPHLAALFSSEKVAALSKQGIAWLEATDPSSLWRMGPGLLAAPTLDCGGEEMLQIYQVENARPAGTFYLYCRE